MSVAQDASSQPNDNPSLLLTSKQQAEDVQQLFVVFAQRGMHYQEIKLEEGLNAIRQRWPLLHEIHRAHF